MVLDHILVQEKFIENVTDTKVIQSVDNSSDHSPVEIVVKAGVTDAEDDFEHAKESI